MVSEARGREGGRKHEAEEGKGETREVGGAIYGRRHSLWRRCGWLRMKRDVGRGCGDLSLEMMGVCDYTYRMSEGAQEMHAMVGRRMTK